MANYYGGGKTNPGHREFQPVLVALAVLAILILVVVYASNALAAGLTAHNNTGSDRTVTARDSAGRLHYLDPGETNTMGSGYRVYVARGTCVRHGWPGTTEAYKKCATDATSTSFWTTRSQWLDVVPN